MVAITRTSQHSLAAECSAAADWPLLAADWCSADMQHSTVLHTTTTPLLRTALHTHNILQIIINTL